MGWPPNLCSDPHKIRYCKTYFLEYREGPPRFDKKVSFELVIKCLARTGLANIFCGGNSTWYGRDESLLSQV